MWWMLARIAGWDGVSDGGQVNVDSISVGSVGGIATINTAGGSLQLSAEVFPSEAANRNVSWSLSGGEVMQV